MLIPSAARTTWCNAQVWYVVKMYRAILSRAVKKMASIALSLNFSLWQQFCLHKSFRRAHTPMSGLRVTVLYNIISRFCISAVASNSKPEN